MTEKGTCPTCLNAAVVTQIKDATHKCCRIKLQMLETGLVVHPSKQNKPCFAVGRPGKGSRTCCCTSNSYLLVGCLQREA